MQPHDAFDLLLDLAGKTCAHASPVPRHVIRGWARDPGLGTGDQVTALIKSVAFDRQALPRPPRGGLAGKDTTA